MTHELKTWPVWFEMVRSGRKTFELRVNDRNYQCGDTLLLREWDPETEVYTGSEERRVVADIIDMSPLSECVAMVFMDDASAALRARVAQLEESLKRIMTTDENGNSMTWPQIDDMVRPLLSSTPAQSLAKVKAAALREAANLIRQTTHDPGVVIFERGRFSGRLDAIEQVEAEAERLEAEAANG